MGLLGKVSVGVIVVVVCFSTVFAAHTMGEYDGILIGMKGQQAVEVLKDPNHTGDVLVSLGNFLAVHGYYEFAENVYGKVGRDDDRSHIARHNAGVVSYWQGDEHSAEQQFQKALEREPEYDRAHYSLGLLYYQQKKYTQSEEHMRAYASQSEDPYGYFDLGVVLAEHFREADGTKHQLEEAKISFEQAHALDPTVPHAAQNAEIVERVLAAV